MPLHRIRDDIDARVQDLLESLTGGRDPAEPAPDLG